MIKGLRRRALHRLGPALAVSLALTGCALLSNDPEYEGPPAPDLRLEKIWDSTSSGIEHVSYALPLGETVIMTEIAAGSDKRAGRTDQTLFALDARTGDVRWKVDNETPLAPVIARTGLTKARPDLEYWYDRQSRGGEAKAALDPAGGLVAVPYSQSSKDAPAEGYTDGWAIVGLDLADGRPRWAYTAIPQLPHDDPAARAGTTPKVIAVTSAAVVINIEATDGGFADPDGTGKPATTIALDPQTGAVLWSAEDTLTFGAVADSIIARSRAGLPPATANDQAGLPIVLEARTGKPRWTGTEPAYIAAVCDSHAVFLAEGSGYKTVELRTLATTETKARSRLVCGDGLLAWLTDDDLRTRVISTERTERGAIALDPGSALHIEVDLRAAVDGYLWGVEWYGLSPSEHPDKWITFAMDRTGSKRARLPGRRLLGVSDRTVIVTTAHGTDDLRPFEVYLIR